MTTPQTEVERKQVESLLDALIGLKDSNPPVYALVYYYVIIALNNNAFNQFSLFPLLKPIDDVLLLQSLIEIKSIFSGMAFEKIPTHPSTIALFALFDQFPFLNPPNIRNLRIEPKTLLKALFGKAFAQLSIRMLEILAEFQPASPFTQHCQIRYAMKTLAESPHAKSAHAKKQFNFRTEQLTEDEKRANQQFSQLAPQADSSLDKFLVELFADNSQSATIVAWKSVQDWVYSQTTQMVQIVVQEQTPPHFSRVEYYPSLATQRSLVPKRGPLPHYSSENKMGVIGDAELPQHDSSTPPGAPQIFDNYFGVDSDPSSRRFINTTGTTTPVILVNPERGVPSGLFSPLDPAATIPVEPQQTTGMQDKVLKNSSAVGDSTPPTESKFQTEPAQPLSADAQPGGNNLLPQDEMRVQHFSPISESEMPAWRTPTPLPDAELSPPAQEQPHYTDVATAVKVATGPLSNALATSPAEKKHSVDETQEAVSQRNVRRKKQSQPNPVNPKNKNHQRRQKQKAAAHDQTAEKATSSQAYATIFVNKAYGLAASVGTSLSYAFCCRRKKKTAAETTSEAIKGIVEREHRAKVR